MSLTQQGIQTAMKRNKKIKGSIEIQSATPKAMKPNNDAQVLSNTCPMWGNLVTGFQQAMAIPIMAAALTISHLGMPMKGMVSVLRKGHSKLHCMCMALPPR